MVHHNVFAPLEDTVEPTQAIASMFDAVGQYFRSGRRICLVGALALSDGRDLFQAQMRAHFARWVAVLAGALTRSGRDRGQAAALAEVTVGHPRRDCARPRTRRPERVRPHDCGAASKTRASQLMRY